MPFQNLILSGAIRTPVKLVGGPRPHSTSGYRQWVGQVEAPEPIVGLAMVVTGSHVSWARTSHRSADSLEARILFAPHDVDARRVSVCFGLLDATAIGLTVVESRLVHPSPRLQELATGQLVDVAHIPGDPDCGLKALFLLRSDVKFVRNGVWHARGDWVEELGDPWRTMLTFGRTGEFTFEEASP